jgi:membrane fusion protein (multidrug efflux system)
VQRLPVRVSLDPEELKKYPLQLGLSMRVTINIHNLKGNRLPKAPVPNFIFQTKIFKNQLADVDPLINNILHANSPRDMFLPRRSHNG